jgi:DNA-binding NtrC family response regulator
MGMNMFVEPMISEGGGPLSIAGGRPEGFAGLVGRSPAMVAVFRQIRCFAASEAPVYIFGETGTGKEQVSRAIHDQSKRARGPFVPVNAAAIGDEIFDSEFFGHVRGAFTGAIANRDGYVATAHGGTLLIDEVADLSARGQIKLLRFLQEKQYRRVGESHLRCADVRILAATNVRLEERVAAGTFREDLHFRLNVLHLRLPALRERVLDVVPLAEHLLARVAEAERKPVPRLSHAVARALEAYDWPGNVRQLHAEMYHAFVFAVGGLIRPEDLSPRLHNVDSGEKASLAQAMAVFEREYVSRALAECSGHRIRTAARLGITRQGLSQMMKRLGMTGTAA